MVSFPDQQLAGNFPHDDAAQADLFYTESIAGAEHRPHVVERRTSSRITVSGSFCAWRDSSSVRRSISIVRSLRIVYVFSDDEKNDQWVEEKITETG